MTSRRLFVAVMILASAVAARGEETESRIAARRVPISLSFSGDSVFLFGKIPADTERVVAVMEGPSLGEARLMEKGRVALFWMGVHQYRLGGAPGYYWINASCPACNGLARCEHSLDLDELNTLLEPWQIVLGPAAVSRSAKLVRLEGEFEPGEEERVLEGFWALQAGRGLYGIRDNAVRINAEAAFYHVFPLPTRAPEGRYHVTTYFFARDRVVGVAENDLLVRKAGLVAWLSRLSERKAFSYGIFTIAVAVGAGWLAGSLFKRGGGH